MRSFSDLGLLAELVEALANQGFTEPFPIQAMTIRDAQHVDVDRLKKRLGLIGEPTVEVFSNDGRLGDLAGFETEALAGAR